MITVIGRGPEPLGPAATALLARAELVVGAARHLDGAPLPTAARVVLGPLAPALDAVAACRGEVVVLASGDPGFFGIVRALAERFGPDALAVHPAPSSVATAFARLGLPWDDAVVASAHGRDLRTAANVCRARRKVAVLTAPGAGPAELAAALLATPGIERRLVVAADLGGAAERVERVTLAEAAERPWPAVNLVLCLGPGAEVAGPMRAVAGAAPGPAGWALPEDAFTHRDSMITKSEVRALALARLGPRLGELVWDVGAGSGSVAVECARLGAAVIAVERDPAGAARVRANAGAHGVDVAVVPGAAPAALAGLPEPDAVFVGGGGAELPAIVAACAGRARRAVVVTLAALDRVPAVRAALGDAGLDVAGVQLQAARLAPLPGEVTRLAAANPVFVLWGTRPAPGPGHAQAADHTVLRETGDRAGTGQARSGVCDRASHGPNAPVPTRDRPPATCRQEPRELPSPPNRSGPPRDAEPAPAAPGGAPRDRGAAGPSGPAEPPPAWAADTSPEAPPGQPGAMPPPNRPEPATADVPTPHRPSGAHP